MKAVFTEEDMKKIDGRRKAGIPWRTLALFEYGGRKWSYVTLLRHYRNYKKKSLLTRLWEWIWD